MIGKLFINAFIFYLFFLGGGGGGEFGVTPLKGDLSCNTDRRANHLATLHPA
jgi:hypothetical protein